MSEDKQKLLQVMGANKINPSDKDRNILPGAGSHGAYGDYPETCGDKAKKYKWWIVGGVVVLLVALILGLTLGKKSGGDDPGPTPPTPIDVYNPYSVDKGTIDTKVQVVTGMLRANQQKLDRLNAQTVLQDGDVIKAAPQSVPTGTNNQLISNVAFEFGQSDYKVAYMRLTDADNQRYSIPESAANKPSFQETLRLDMCGFELFDDPFGFKFTDDRTGNAYLSTENSAFIMQDKYMQLDINLPTRRIYGLGERTKDLLIGEGTWTMWANGQETPTDDGTGGKQTYGVHPFMLVQSSTKNEFFGLYFRNSNAMSPIVQYTDDDKALFSYITTGGQIEIYFMFKGSATDIIKQYHSIIGKPTLTPFWSLGWHASAYAYKTQADVQANIDGYATAGIPLEGIWLDIPYMNDYADFTVDPVAFPTLKEMTDTIHANGQRIIPIVDAGISSNDTQNKYFAMAASNNCLLLSSQNPDVQNGFLSQHVWPFDDMATVPAHTVFLDFFSPAAKDVWATGLQDLYDQFAYDGLWLDMNEATGFCNGECPNGLVPNYTESVGAKTEGKSFSKLFTSFLGLDDDETLTNHTWWQSYNTQNENSTYDLPFIPGGRWNLDNMSISLNATHPSNNMREYDLHSLYGHSEGMVTRDIMTNQTITPIKNKRTFLLARSTFAGSGAHVQHWLGDNHRTWEDMKSSIAGVMNFNMFGIPMVGPDTCGFFGESGQDEICGRWIQLATFYPFARQHRDISGGGDPNEPYNLQEPYQSWAKNALFDRLQYVRQMYTCLFEASENGGTCFDPLFFHYPEVDGVHENYENQFIAAGHLLVTPVLEAGADLVTSYFPNGKWVSMKNFTFVYEMNDPSGGATATFEAPNSNSDTVNVYLKPGSIVQVQNNTDHQHMTTGDIMANGTTALVINPDDQNHAEGTVFLDDGESLDQLSSRQYEYYKFQLNGGTLNKWLLNQDNQASTGVNIDKVVITNAASYATVDFACVTGADGIKITLTPEFDAVTNILNFTMINGTDPISFFDFQSLYFGDKTKDVNLCDPLSQFYRFADGETPDLSGPETTVVLTNSAPAVFPPIKLEMSVLYTNNLNIHWNFNETVEGMKTPFEIPAQIIDADRKQINKTGVLSEYITVNQDATGPMTIEVSNSQGVKVWSLNNFMLGEYINLIDSSAHTSNTNFKGVLGLVEQVSNDLFMPDGIFSLWSRDIPNPVQTGKLPGQNMYGTHPFYMAKATDASWFGVFQNNAAAQDWIIKNDPTTGDVSLKTIATGGAGNMYFMFAAEPNYLTELYHSIVGPPVLPPQWSLGWHQCRWGYKNLDMLKEVVANYTLFNLTLDTMWSDIDYLNKYEDFTYDHVNFDGLGDWVNGLHDQSMHYIPIIDAGIAKREGYEVYEDGVNQDVFIKIENGDVFTGQVWPDDAAFPDWFGENTASWWGNWLSKLHDQVGFDGLWEDMNEASNFCNGVCYENERAMDPIKNKIPYTPSGRDLEEKSITLDGQHAGDITELDVHSLFGTMEVKATHDWFIAQGKRPMIIERSAYAGMGKYGSRWLGDNFSQEAYMGYSVTGIMAHNIAGIQLAGSDICGFIGDTNAELCARWYMVGAFYPFSRNHNAWDSMPQEPWHFQEVYDQSVSYLDIIRYAQEVKMSMIKYYYTWMSLNSYGGGAFYKPLFFDYPNDDAAMNASQNHNIMLGSALKLSIQSTTLGKDGGNSTEFYFPAGLWCNVFNKDGTNGCMDLSAGQSMTLSTLAYEFYLHMAAGNIAPMQDGKTLHMNSNVTTIAGLQEHPVDFHILPACDASACNAQGIYLNDDGETLDLDGSQNNYILYYNQDITNSPMNLTVVVDHILKAKNVQSTEGDYIVNSNDDMQSIEIYNAQAMGISTTSYTTEATMDDGSLVTLANATYDTTSDRLVFVNDATAVPHLWLPQVKSITFTAAA